MVLVCGRKCADPCQGRRARSSRSSSSNNNNNDRLGSAGRLNKRKLTTRSIHSLIHRRMILFGGKMMHYRNPSVNSGTYDRQAGSRATSSAVLPSAAHRPSPPSPRVDSGCLATKRCSPAPRGCTRLNLPRRAGPPTSHLGPPALAPPPTSCPTPHARPGCSTVLPTRWSIVPRGRRPDQRGREAAGRVLCTPRRRRATSR